jgi:hypothetical protein
MTLKLHNLHPAPGAKKAKRRVGRGGWLHHRPGLARCPMSVNTCLWGRRASSKHISTRLLVENGSSRRIFTFGGVRLICRTMEVRASCFKVVGDCALTGAGVDVAETLISPRYTRDWASM